MASQTRFRVDFRVIWGADQDRLLEKNFRTRNKGFPRAPGVKIFLFSFFSCFTKKGVIGVADQDRLSEKIVRPQIKRFSGGPNFPPGVKTFIFLFLSSKKG